MLKRHIAITTIGCAMLATAAMAQTGAPTPPATTAPAATSAKESSQNLAAPGKWRASKLMGVDIYGPDKKKIGDVTEVVFDKSGMIETVTVGVGGFLGIGAKDVAIPFGQITWSDQPMVDAAPAPSGGSGVGNGAVAPATTAAKSPTMYPDHGMVSMTKDQLSAAPAVTYSGS